MPATQPYQNLAPYYDSLMPEQWYRGYYRFIKENLKRQGVGAGTVLELACGTGRLTKYLARGFAKVYGVDFSGPMLEVAKKRLPSVRFFQENLTDFARPPKTDLVVCMFDSFNYLKQPDFRSALARVYEKLNDGGVFIFDLNGEAAFARGEKKFVANQREISVKGGRIVWKNLFYPTRWVAEFDFFANGSLAAESSETHVEYFHSPKKVAKLLKQSGFELVGLYSDFDFSTPSDKNKRYYFVATKKPTRRVG